MLCKTESCHCKLSHGSKGVSRDRRRTRSGSGSTDVTVVTIVTLAKFPMFVCNIKCSCSWRLIDGSHILLLLIKLVREQLERYITIYQCNSPLM